MRILSVVVSWCHEGLLIFLVHSQKILSNIHACEDVFWYSVVSSRVTESGDLLSLRYYSPVEVTVLPYCIYPSVYTSFSCLSIYLSFCQSSFIYLCLLSVCLSGHPSAHLSINPPPPPPTRHTASGVRALSTVVESPEEGGLSPFSHLSLRTC